MNFLKKQRNLFAACFFLMSLGLFILQMGYLFLPNLVGREVEYIHNQLFYLINIACILSLAISFLLYFQQTRKWLLIGGSVFTLFIVVNTYLIYTTSQEVNNIVSLSPDGKHTLVLKQDKEQGDIIYYREYYTILARPLQRISASEHELQVEWLANDVAAVTYQDHNQNIQQHIATYGDRGDGISYYYVSSEIYGEWQDGETRVISGPEGISVEDNGERQTFAWENIQQHGTLAIVLSDDEHNAAWTIALAENFEISSNATVEQPGDIRVYKATLGDADVNTLERFGN
ncbi:hypothetical protein [Alkalicoccobacillus porphyridii]|uniref:Uncharacterized protein n=1 Tax=Alkalicoccobacillus porphyridii TaxID=2597270 RepID=A0A554A3K2_9BACI|nr:hypothetical protein [Alkalicoccobacillus porphyridii]TSB48236.1 hypothetical protein FN960_01400 [Alkalicoccobacillus porphyridii]